jgi:mannose-6-phosphate isomerase-like protein (cupin superfamily)
MTTPIRFEANRDSLTLGKDLSAQLCNNQSPFTPPEGYSFSVVSMERRAPHNGEMHPDGDEIIYVISGKISVKLEFEDTIVMEVDTDAGLVIPKGVWHKIEVIEPASLVILTPGPRFEFRPLA